MDDVIALALGLGIGFAVLSPAMKLLLIPFEEMDRKRRLREFETTIKAVYENMPPPESIHIVLDFDERSK